MVGERGSKLSGGQLPRITSAGALLEGAAGVRLAVAPSAGESVGGAGVRRARQDGGGGRRRSAPPIKIHIFNTWSPQFI